MNPAKSIIMLTIVFSNVFHVAAFSKIDLTPIEPIDYIKKLL